MNHLFNSLVIIIFPYLENQPVQYISPIISSTVVLKEPQIHTAVNTLLYPTTLYKCSEVPSIVSYLGI